MKILLTFTSITCCECGLVFAVEDVYERRLRETHKGFYCPSGHSLLFGGKTKCEKRIDELKAAAKLQNKRLDSLQNVKSELRMTRRSLAATQGVVTKLKKAAPK